MMAQRIMNLGFKILFLVLGVTVIIFFVNQLVLTMSIDEAQKKHFKHWKEKEFYPNQYLATVFDVEYADNQEVVYLKMKNLVSDEYINEGYLCLNTHVKLKDTIYKKQNSYELFIVNNVDTLKLEYDFCGKGSE